MKTNRNDSCPCGSGKKYKHCCEAKTLQKGDGSPVIRWLITGAVGIFLAVLVWGVVEFFSAEHPEMEAYKCDNPNCNQIHYRPKTDTN
ncbi:MAG: SEC-C metal-binding domain-containing protein [Candidatus Marinimicrobia bacterium]|jgi:hypothetical protein|nr:SEC-C metal-binding domain-containing protein [Candidatus Neomarinimicrobiota bacterium]